jgi:hypothetical protein
MRDAMTCVLTFHCSAVDGPCLPVVSRMKLRSHWLTRMPKHIFLNRGTHLLGGGLCESEDTGKELQA